MEKSYNPSSIEEKLYSSWIEKGFFKAKVNKNKKPFTIIMPPPNITSKLHMGHAFQQTIQDVIIRRKRMQGFEALWVPGTDHAALSTEYMLCKQLEKEGLTKEMLGREEFGKRISEWYKNYKGTIINQFKRMGYSCDWDRLRFTMDEQNCRAVRKVFVHLFKKGWIYKGKRIVNWCPKCKSSISDAEVEFKELPSHLWHIRYKIEGSNDYIQVATTRPETLLGDTAVAVNPNDDRYKSLIGKKVVLPLVNKLIPIIADDYVETDFGTGVVKITPAHDPNDFEVGLRHNLEVIKVIGDDGVLNEKAGKYAGLDRIKAREVIVEDLKKLGHLVKIENYNHNVGHCERCKTIIEPLVSSQWYVKMSELKKPAIKVVEEDKVHFVDEQYKKSYLHWMYNLEDWCISRQIWSGHDIPIFTCKDCGEIICEEEDPTICPKCGSKNLEKEQDKLDTWFSSALWPISTLGYPDKTPELEYFYPTNVMVTAREIINLWVARMIFSGIEYVGDIPFKDVVINGIVKDINGKKMSKTLGNGVDPIEMIEKYGVDALRFSLLEGISIQSDSRFSEKKVELTSNFINKIWNASKFVLMQTENINIKSLSECKLSLADKWILTQLNSLILSVDEKFDKYDIGMCASELYDFFWTKFCDWYIELSKTNLQSEDVEIKQASVSTLNYVLTNLLKMLHPFIPFVTEEIYLNLPNHDESIMISNWPKFDSKLNFEDENTKFNNVLNIVRAIRNERKNIGIEDKTKISMHLQILDDKEFYLSCVKYIQKLSNSNEITILDGNKQVPINVASLIFDKVKIYIELPKVDHEKELDKLNESLKQEEFEIQRAQKMLSNENFVSKAPEKLVLAEKEKLKSHIEKREHILREIEKVSNK